MFTVASVVQLIPRVDHKHLMAQLPQLCVMLSDHRNWASQLAAGHILRKLPVTVLMCHKQQLLSSLAAAATSCDWRVHHRVCGILDLFPASASVQVGQIRCLIAGNRIRHSNACCPTCGAGLMNAIHKDFTYMTCDVCFDAVPFHSSIFCCIQCDFACCHACTNQYNSYACTNQYNSCYKCHDKC